MRYQTESKGETSYLVGSFATGETVTIALYDLSDGSVVALDSNACSEINATGWYRWGADNITTPSLTIKHYLYVMTDSTGDTYSGKIVVGGYVDNIASASSVENIVITSASTIWTHDTRTITSASGLELASASSVANITGTSASTIWTYGTRELTTSTPSTSASEIWAFETRTITSASDLGLASASSVENITGTSASTIWEYNTRTITSASDLGLASASSVENITGTSASTIWTYGSRTLTSFGTLVTDIWNYITRTLSPRSQGDVTSETTINCFRGDTFTYVFDGLDFSNYSKVYVTVKRNYQDLDSAAIIQVDSETGLLYLNGVASGSPTMASITVNSVDRATLVLKPFVTSQIPYGSYTLYYDIQIVYTTGVVRTLQYGEFVLGRDVTRRIT